MSTRHIVLCATLMLALSLSSSADPLVDRLINAERELITVRSLLHERQATAVPKPGNAQATCETETQRTPQAPCKLCCIFPLALAAAALGAVLRGGHSRPGMTTSASSVLSTLAHIALFVAVLHAVGFTMMLPLWLLSWLLSGNGLLWLVFAPCTFCILMSTLSTLSFGALFGCSSSPCTPAPPGSPLPAAPLSRGSSGPGVAQLQQALIKLGRMSPSAIRYCAGLYGPRTHAAVAAVQEEDMGVVATGVFDDAVRAHLLTALAPQHSTAPEAPQPTEVAAVAKGTEKNSSNTEMQQKATLLLEMGFSEAEVAGAMEATGGSLGRAADWLCEQRTQATPDYQEEWQAQLTDLCQMGFEEGAAKDALIHTQGQLKEAIKTLVTAERLRK